MRRESVAEMWFLGFTMRWREGELEQVAEREWDVLIVRVLRAERGAL